MKLKKQLPKKLWQALGVALRDMDWVVKNKKATINMGDWVFRPYKDNDDGDDDDKCQVCMAGAIMLCQGPKMDKEEHHRSPSNFDAKTRNKLYAIDDLREGQIASALGRWYGQHSPELEQWLQWHVDQVVVPSYHYAPRGWRKMMEKIITKLKQENL